MTENRDRNVDLQGRDDRTILKLELGEVIDVLPHRFPYADGGGDRDFNLVEVLPLQRLYDNNGNPIVPPRTRKRVMCLPPLHINMAGKPWTPRIGDMVILGWMQNKRPYILAPYPNHEQEPVCRPNSDAENYDIVNKNAKWRRPTQNEEWDFIYFPPPQHPDCKKWWHKWNEWIFCQDCKLGHENPCDQCDTIDRHGVGYTWLKILSDLTESEIDPPWRVFFHHRSGSQVIFDIDGKILVENRVPVIGSDGWPVDEVQKGHIYFDPSGTIEAHSKPTGTEGARLTLHGDDGSDGECVLENLENAAHVKIYASGKIELKRGQGTITINESGEIDITGPKVTINSETIELNGAVAVDGSLTINGTSCNAGV